MKFLIIKNKDINLLKSKLYTLKVLLHCIKLKQLKLQPLFKADFYTNYRGFLQYVDLPFSVFAFFFGSIWLFFLNIPFYTVSPVQMCSVCQFSINRPYFFISFLETGLILYKC